MAIPSSLGAGHKVVLITQTRNLHISNFIKILNKIKDKTGSYAIVSATNNKWSEFYGGNTINKNLEVVPAKK